MNVGRNGRNSLRARADALRPGHSRDDPAVAGRVVAHVARHADADDAAPAGPAAWRHMGLRAGGVLLLARAGVEVLVLEKHADFLRDFRGDTIHPSTLEVMHELGLLEALLKLPHQKTPRINARFGNLALTVADFTHLKTRCPFVVLMPQWDFLNLLAGQAGRCPTFKLRMNAEVTGLIREDGHIVGLQAATPDGPLTVHAMLIIGTDGRHSVVRAQAGLGGVDFGAPMDVLWFRFRGARTIR